MSILDTHTSFIKYAQEQYQEAVNAQSSQNAQFWLGQLHLLCEQMYWLSQAAGPPVVIGKMPTGLEYKSFVQNYSREPGRVIQEPVKRTPTEYEWSDGFEGVKLE